MVVLDAVNSIISKAEVDRMSSQHYVSSPYVQPLPNEVCTYIDFEWNRQGSSEARTESVWRVCEWALLVKSVSKLYLQVDLICQNRHLVSYRQVPGSIPGQHWFFPPFLSLFDSVPLLFHSNFQSWQICSLPTLDPYVFLFVNIDQFCILCQVYSLFWKSRITLVNGRGAVEKS